MYEDVKTYLAAVEAADQEYRNTALQGVGKHDESTCRICVREAAYAAAWQPLKASSVPLVAWIAENAVDYQDAAMVVLEALPASMAVLDGIAAEQRWCTAWTRLRASADAAGVLPQDAEVSA